MRSIAKGPEPASLTTHRNMPHCDYDNYADKDTLRAALVADQRGLCCYCMCGITDQRETMKIEHWRSRSTFPDEELEFRNVLAACRGGEGQPLRQQHCDTRKGDQDLRWNPADPMCCIEDRVGYASDGAIQSDDPVFDQQLNHVLNLNLARIMRLSRSRKSVSDTPLASISTCPLAGMTPAAVNPAGLYDSLEPIAQGRR